jgi:hypothetical protein
VPWKIIQPSPGALLAVVAVLSDERNWRGLKKEFATRFSFLVLLRNSTERGATEE